MMFKRNITEVDIGRKKAKKRKRRAIISIIIAAAAAFVLAVVFLFKTQEITYEGNTVESEEELNEMLFGGSAPNTLMYKLFGNKNKDIPFVDKYEVNIQWPNKMRVVISEKKQVAYFYYAGTTMYVDAQGRITDTSTDPMDNVPVLEGLDIVSLTYGDKPVVSDEEAYDNEVLYATLAIKNNIPITKVYTDNGSVYVSIGDASVQCGTTMYAEEKMQLLGRMYMEMDGMKGTLYLQDYDGKNTDLIFKKGN